MRPQTLKQHVAGIDVRGLCDLKQIMLSLPLASADIISRRFVKWPGPAKKNKMWIQTVWNSDMDGDRGGRGSGPPHENHKLPFVS